MRYLSALFALFSMLPGLHAAGQVLHRKQTVPLEIPVHITLVSLDTSAFPFENLHYFKYNGSTGTVEAGFLIEKVYDGYKITGDTTVVLSRNYGCILRKGPDGKNLWLSGCSVVDGAFTQINDTSFLHFSFHEDAQKPILRIRPDEHHTK